MNKKTVFIYGESLYISGLRLRLMKNKELLIKRGSCDFEGIKDIKADILLVDDEDLNLEIINEFISNNPLVKVISLKPEDKEVTSMLIEKLHINGTDDLIDLIQKE